LYRKSCSVGNGIIYMVRRDTQLPVVHLNLENDGCSNLPDIWASFYLSPPPKGGLDLVTKILLEIIATCAGVMVGMGRQFASIILSHNKKIAECRVVAWAQTEMPSSSKVAPVGLSKLGPVFSEPQLGIPELLLGSLENQRSLV